MKYGALVWGVWWRVWLQRPLPCGILCPHLDSEQLSLEGAIASLAPQVCTAESLCFALRAFSKAEWLSSPQVGTTLKDGSMAWLMPLGASLHQWYESQRVNSLASLAFGGITLRNYATYVSLKVSNGTECCIHQLANCCCQVASVLSDSVRPQRRQPSRLPRPWDSPGKSTGVGCHFLLQCMKVKSESEVAQSCPTLSNPMDCSPPGSSIHGIFQARVLEWGAIAISVSLLAFLLSLTLSLTSSLFPPGNFSPINDYIQALASGECFQENTD